LTKVSGGLEVCENASKHVFNRSRRSIISFLKKSFWWCGVCENASKHVFNRSRRSIISFLKKSFWWCGSMRKWNKTRLLPLQTGKNIFFEKKFLVIWKYAQMHQNTFLTTPDVQKYLF
jgi:hypothetical protein